MSGYQAGRQIELACRGREAAVFDNFDKRQHGRKSIHGSAPNMGMVPAFTIKILTERFLCCGAIKSSGRAAGQASALRPAISATHPGPDEILKSNPCSFTIAFTRLSPSPRPGSHRLLSER